MAHLYVKGQQEPIRFDDSKYDALQTMFTNFVEGRGDGVIRLPNFTTTASQIRKIVRAPKQEIPSVVSTVDVRDFEKMLTDYCSKAETELEGDDLSHYGQPPYWKKVDTKVKKLLESSVDEDNVKHVSDILSEDSDVPTPIGLRKRGGSAPHPDSGLHPEYTVSNKMLGLVHFGVVKYCEEMGYIRKEEFYGWTICSHQFLDFQKMHRLMVDLQARRVYARKMEAEQLEKSSGVISESI